MALQSFLVSRAASGGPRENLSDQLASYPRHLPSLISGKNGSASERAATSSQTGNSPGRWPKRSR